MAAGWSQPVARSGDHPSGMPPPFGPKALQLAAEAPLMVSDMGPSVKAATVS